MSRGAILILPNRDFPSPQEYIRSFLSGTRGHIAGNWAGSLPPGGVLREGEEHRAEVKIGERVRVGGQ